MPYPQTIMADVLWSFQEPTFASQAAFVAAVHEYHQELEMEETWQPDAVVLPCLRVRIEHTEGEESEESSAEFTTENPAGFTAGELLFKVHNAFAEQLQEQAHFFFEGFSLLEEPEGEAPPVYEIDLGS